MSIKYMLVGNPNCGKTTIFNALTYENQRIGNWPGVTVEKKSGYLANSDVEIIDLPGLYSINQDTKFVNADEKIAIDNILSTNNTILVNIIDASKIERHLYLTTQLLALKKPMIIVLNMMDLATKKGINIDIKLLSEKLNCPIIIMQAHKNKGLESLKNLLLNIDENKNTIPSTINHEDLLSNINISKTIAKPLLGEKLDKILLHKFFAIPLFFCIMYIMFFLAMNIGSVVQAGLDIFTQGIFVDLPTYWLLKYNAPILIITILTQGLGIALQTILGFIPVLITMYASLALLEQSGYMSRAAFVIDRLMRYLGLSGKAFIPMVIGFGCNVPGIMAARTMESPQERYLTMMMSPFMSCGARLAIYAVFVQAFFPHKGYLVIFSLYCIGILVAVMTGFLLRKTWLPGKISPLIMELPAYHIPSLKRIYKETSFRLKQSIKRASTIIIPACIILSIINNFMNLEILGKLLTPILAPMGIQNNNWPASIGLLSGVLAKEVVIGTLNNLYMSMQSITHNTDILSADIFTICTNAKIALITQAHIFIQLILHPLQIPSSNNIQNNLFTQYFANQYCVFAYLLFILLYMPCISTIAALRKEAGSKIMWFCVLWSFWIAYAMSTSFYQAYRLFTYPIQSLIWFGFIFVGTSLFIIILKLNTKSFKDKYALSNSSQNFCKSSCKGCTAAMV